MQNLQYEHKKKHHNQTLIRKDFSKVPRRTWGLHFHGMKSLIPSDWARPASSSTSKTITPTPFFSFYCSVQNLGLCAPQCDLTAPPLEHTTHCPSRIALKYHSAHESPNCKFPCFKTKLLSVTPWSICGNPFLLSFHVMGIIIFICQMRKLRPVKTIQLIQATK